MFTDTSELLEITVYDSLTSIESGAFAGCPSLCGIHIMNDNEATLTVDQVTLFDGAPAQMKIYLHSQKSYTSFVSGYFWSAYASRMILIKP